MACSSCSDSDGEEGTFGSDDSAAAVVEVEATTGQGRDVAGSHCSMQQAAAPPKNCVNGQGQAAAAGDKASGKTAAAAAAATAAALAMRPDVDFDLVLQFVTGKRRPGQGTS